MSTIDDLYYGNLHPCDRDIVRGSRTDRLLRLLCKNEESLTATLTDKQKETFLKFKNCQDELTSITEREAFKIGFTLATRLMVEVMDGLKPLKKRNTHKSNRSTLRLTCLIIHSSFVTTNAFTRAHSASNSGCERSGAKASLCNVRS